LALNEEQLVLLAEQIVSDLKEQLEGQEETGRTQAAKAIEVAMATESLLVFRNWLRYQMFRLKFWRTGEPGPELATRVEQAVARIEREAEPPEMMAQVARFLGYFRRALMAVQYLEQIPPARARGVG